MIYKSEIVLPRLTGHVNARYSVKGVSDKARRDMEKLFLSYGFLKEQKSPTYYREMSCEEWASFVDEFRSCVERLSSYATFSSLKLWLDGELIYDLGAQQDLDFKQAA